MFVPDNEAFRDFINSKPEYNAISDIPMQEVREIVRFHIIQNPWSRDQLRSLDINGWINERDPLNDEPFGYKRQTLLKNENRGYWIKTEINVESIVDSVQGQEKRIVFNPSRKYAPFFFDEYLSAANISHSDYSFFFNRPFDAGGIFFCKC
jgi:hypothetical protein